MLPGTTSHRASSRGPGSIHLPAPTTGKITQLQTPLPFPIRAGLVQTLLLSMVCVCQRVCTLVHEPGEQQGGGRAGAQLPAGFGTDCCGQRWMPSLPFPFQSPRPQKPAKDRQAGPSQPWCRMGKVSCTAVVCRGPSWLRAGGEQRPPPVTRCPSVEHPDSLAPRARALGTPLLCRPWPSPVPEVHRGSHQLGCPKHPPYPAVSCPVSLPSWHCQIQARWHRCAVARAVTSQGKQCPSHRLLPPSR